MASLLLITKRWTTFGTGDTEQPSGLTSHVMVAVNRMEEDKSSSKEENKPSAGEGYGTAFGARENDSFMI
jgi:hypothetical protein